MCTVLQAGVKSVQIPGSAWTPVRRLTALPLLSRVVVVGGGDDGRGAQLVRSWTRGSCSSIQQIPSRVATPALGAGWRLFALTGSIEARSGAAGGEGGR